MGVFTQCLQMMTLMSTSNVSACPIAFFLVFMFYQFLLKIYSNLDVKINAGGRYTLAPQSLTETLLKNQDKRHSFTL